MFENMFSKKPPRFTLLELRRLNDVLVHHRTVTAANRDVLIGTFREIAELMIWGDQHEPSFFDLFVELKTLAHFCRFMSLKKGGGGWRGGLTLQLLQTLSIMVQNTREETSLFYLFSNNHINELIEAELDFQDEEVMAYYISFLKTISLKLNEKTIQFFFFAEEPTRGRAGQRRARGRDGGGVGGDRDGGESGGSGGGGGCGGILGRGGVGGAGRGGGGG
jgi:protein CLEC16A